ncbi:HupE/UreJ family protein [Cellulophaga omnivescoria]|uniref:HupE/UreJ family protein n=1 Tax=Cellulophaga omnivescoria TaxID=1888890 RepID=UPI000984C9D3|nr:HupE/UreJ family protein [Cellulophaga omnivescoria]WBU90916.1 HupE/UreJ family protein [Cellulophaga omnivescoria]WKB83052.1 HupE/UreJ family protein [Cellulophaga lytica]
MEQFLFYIGLGLEHVLDLSAYDHILFLTALAIPFTFKDWKNVLLLATVFTVTHCFSLGLSSYGYVTPDVSLIEFLIPVTIFITALFNIYAAKNKQTLASVKLHVIATAFFGLVHGFGFSNYFKMLMAEEDNKFTPLLGFATGIEMSQILILILALLLTYIVVSLFQIKQWLYAIVASVIVLAITIPMLIDTFPY